MQLRCLIWQIRVIEKEFDEALINGLAQHQTYGQNDIRLTIYSRLRGIQRSTALSFIFMEDHLAEPEWWRSLSHDMMWSLPMNEIEIDSILPRVFDDYMSFQTVAFVQGLCSAVESSFRVFVRAMDPTACNNGNAEFMSIYEWLMRELGLQNYLPLLNLLRLIRNTIHNNGVYFHPAGQTDSVDYRNIFYEFQYGNPPPLKNVWKLLQFWMMPDVFRMMVDVVESIRLTGIGVPIPDPFQ
jgi:hypothetical protein